MKKIFKILAILLIIFNIYALFFNVNAIDIWNTGKDFLHAGQDELGDFDSTGMSNSFRNIVDFLWGIGLLVILIFTVVLGIKYMLVLPNEKSRLKQATTPYIVGVVIIFGALTIWKFIINIFEGSIGG